MKLNGVKRAEKLSNEGDLYRKFSAKYKTKNNGRKAARKDRNKKESLIVFEMLKLHFVGGHESSAR